ncbi:MAG: DegV family protein [Oscillibacter sp.]|jgi:DegV family protein with EDD domain|nr:DegV family protein [Oscillibacter sp.]
MSMTAIVTDTNSGISPGEAEKLGIFLIPMPFLINGIQQLEGETCTPEWFFKRLNEGAEVSTSQPSPDSILKLWGRLLREYDNVLHFPMSSALSSSCQTARALSREYPGRVFVVDNRRISVTLLQSVLQARRLVAEGNSAARVREILERESLESSAYLAVNTLKYLKKSGRVTAAGAAMATVLNLKPVLQIQGGKLDAFRKARGMAQAERIMLEALRADLNGRFAGRDMALFAAYSGAAAAGAAWLKKVQAAFPEQEVRLGILPLSICCHVGDGTLAAACAKR